MSKIMIHTTHGKEEIERPSLAFVVGNAALSSGQEAILLLTIDGVWLATHGFTDGLQADGFAPIAETMAAFIKNGGKIWVCGACMKPRNITADQLIAGAEGKYIDTDRRRRDEVPEDIGEGTGEDPEAQCECQELITCGAG